MTLSETINPLVLCLLDPELTPVPEIQFSKAIDVPESRMEGNAREDMSYAAAVEARGIRRQHGGGFQAGVISPRHGGGMAPPRAGCRFPATAAGPVADAGEM